MDEDLLLLVLVVTQDIAILNYAALISTLNKSIGRVHFLTFLAKQQLKLFLLLQNLGTAALFKVLSKTTIEIVCITPKVLICCYKTFLGSISPVLQTNIG